MKLVCTMPVRNEDWIIGLSARAVLLWCDLLVVMNHRSTDGTRRILEEICVEQPGKLLIMDNDDAQWEEMKHRQALLTVARQYDATHIVMVDADEVLTGNLLPSIRGMIEALPRGVTMCLPWICLRGGLDRYHVDGTWGNAQVSMAFLDEPRCHWAARDGYDFHHRHPMGRPYVPHVPTHDGGLMHLQFVSDRRLRAKQALYKMLEVIRWPDHMPIEKVDRMYNVAVYGYETPNRLGCGLLGSVLESWWKPYWPITCKDAIDMTQTPWQEAECKRLYAEYGAAKFAGLDLFGVIR